MTDRKTLGKRLKKVYKMRREIIDSPDAGGEKYRHPVKKDGTWDPFSDDNPEDRANRIIKKIKRKLDR